MIIDRCTVHETQATKASYKKFACECILIPGGCTKYFHALNSIVTRNFNRAYELAIIDV